MWRTSGPTWRRHWTASDAGTAGHNPGGTYPETHHGGGCQSKADTWCGVAVSTAQHHTFSFQTLRTRTAAEAAGCTESSRFTRLATGREQSLHTARNSQRAVASYGWHWQRAVASYGWHFCRAGISSAVLLSVVISTRQAMIPLLAGVLTPSMCRGTPLAKTTTAGCGVVRRCTDTAHNSPIFPPVYCLLALLAFLSRISSLFSSLSWRCCCAYQGITLSTTDVM